jgi:NitT/TauT family transport system substrate-binding protein
MRHRKRLAIAIIILCVFGTSGGLWTACKRREQPVQRRDVTVNEAAHTLLYLPLYHAISRGFFAKRNLTIRVVTGGTATNAMAALLGKSADFAQADPMYVPISRSHGAATKVVAQVVARIALWAVTTDPNMRTLDAVTLKHKTVTTHPRPMTAYTYTNLLARSLGLDPDTDIKILQNQPGSELAPLLTNNASIAITIEPQVSIAVSRGAHVVYSFASRDQIFTGLLTRDDVIRDHPDVVRDVVASFQEALDDIHASPDRALETAVKYFPGVSRDVLAAALQRLNADGVIPRSVRVNEDSWNRAVAVRIDSGDLKPPVPAYNECVDNTFSR